MILEGIVTTLRGDAAHIAPMGSRLFEPFVLEVGSCFVLQPYRTARTFAHLLSHREGVLHVSDDVLLMARAAVGLVESLPPLLPTVVVRGWVLADCCRGYEFRISDVEDSSERATLRAEVVYVHRLREFFGFNRAMHAVLEAAILATRTSFLSSAQIAEDFKRLAVLVAKTGGPREQEAFELLQTFVQKVGVSIKAERTEQE